VQKLIVALKQQGVCNIINKTRSIPLNAGVKAVMDGIIAPDEFHVVDAGEFQV